uniref:Uncharacterized protein n=1 Tax=Aegilops tauschii subsp. strangulata TaxID=200361 RepID=A0A453C7V2_AEGTS
PPYIQRAPISSLLSSGAVPPQPRRLVSHGEPAAGAAAGQPAWTWRSQPAAHVRPAAAKP